MTLPAYLRILQTLRARLADNEWRVGDQLPTDEELVHEFGVSRFTVRAALDVLVADGVIKRYRRRGTFVNARPRGAGSWMLTSLDDLVTVGFPTPPIILDARQSVCDPQAAAALDLYDDACALRIRVLRRADREPYAYSVIHIPTVLARNLPRDWQERARTEPFVSIVAEANGLLVHKATQIAEAVAAPPSIAALLETAVGAPLLKLERIFFARPATALQHAQILCRPDRYRQIIEFRASTAIGVKEFQ